MNDRPAPKNQNFLALFFEMSILFRKLMAIIDLQYRYSSTWSNRHI